jgi:hypothetical protein
VTSKVGVKEKNGGTFSEKNNRTAALNIPNLIGSAINMEERKRHWPNLVKDLCERLQEIKTQCKTLFKKEMKTYPLEEAEMPKKISSIEIDNLRLRWIMLQKTLCEECYLCNYEFIHQPIYNQVENLLVDATMSTVALAAQSNLEEELEIVCRIEFLQNHIAKNINMTCNPNIMP